MLEISFDSLLRPQPIRSIWAIGRNYAAHAKELGNAVPEQPLVFQKPLSALQYAATGSVYLHRVAPDTGATPTSIHHEVELVIALGSQHAPHPLWMMGEQPVRHLTREEALSGILAFTVGLDLTAREWQSEAKKQGHPWTRAKGFPGSAVLGPWVDGSQLPAEFGLALEVDDKLQQHGSSRDMIHSLADLVCGLARDFGVLPGDLIYTGTPSGVGPLEPGQRLTARLTGATTDASTDGSPAPATVLEWKSVTV